jgi:hypothetical protein
VRAVVAIVAVAACTPNVPAKQAPKGDVIDTLSIGSNNAAVTIETIGSAASASPEALRQYLLSKAPIDHRQALSDGFAATFGGHTHVLRERHNRWFRCHADVTDDAMRDEVIALCKSYKLPAKP